MIDVTEQKKEQEQILVLSHIIEQIPLSIMITDPDGTIQYVNSSLLNLSGYSKDEVVGENPRIFKSGELPPEYYERMWKTLSSGNNWRGVFHNKMKNGELYWDSVLISPLKNINGEVINYIGIKEDVTEKKLLESTLIDHERLIRAVVNHVKEGVILSNIDGYIKMFSKGAEEIFGYSAGEVMGKPITILMEETLKIKHLAGMSKFRKTKALSKHHVIFETEGIKKDGSPVAIELSLTQMEQRGEVLVVGTIRDISEHKKNEKELKLAQELLLISSKLASIGELAAGVSHEVLNPVNIISVHTQMLQRKTLDDPKTQNFCIKVRHEIDRIQKIVNGLLTFSRTGSQKPEKIVLRDTIEEVLNLVEEKYKQDNIQINREWYEEPVELECDPDKMRQVFLNLVQNAKYAMPKGGVITIQCAGIKKQGKDYLQYKISDTGTGMSKDVMAKIFEPFFTTKPQGQGTGMGLSVVHGIIQEHGGEIRVESEEGKGTTFYIDLPLS